MGLNLNYIQSYSSYRIVNTFRLCYIKQLYIILYRETTAAWSENHEELINTTSKRDKEFFDVKPGGTYGNHWALNG